MSNPLKRTRAADPSCDIPRLPNLSLDVLLQVYTHPSLRRSNSLPEEYGDNERLSQLGSAVLDAVVTHTLFNRRPMLGSLDICSHRSEVLSDTNIARWATLYNMYSRLRCLPELRATINTPREHRSLFCAYVGAVYLERGLEAVKQWTDALLRYSAVTSPQHIKHEPMEDWSAPQAKRRQIDIASSSPLSRSPRVAYASRPSTPPSSPSLADTSSRRVSSEPSEHGSSGSIGPPPPPDKFQGNRDSDSDSTPVFVASQPPPSPPGPAPNTPAAASVDDTPYVQPPVPVFYAQQPAPSLPLQTSLQSASAKVETEAPLRFEHLLNQICVERGLPVSYVESCEGPLHEGRWNVRCIVEDAQLGTGSATSRLFAKDVAAREAYYAMGGDYEDSIPVCPKKSRAHRNRARRRLRARAEAVGGSSVPTPGQHAARNHPVLPYPTG
ncbi:putative double-stranded RNA binding motif containing protein [Lyophyllum shimeji]|uniref:Double-stranded RNA binding motif containing protein n=1 Tax=Lyophyllum shimeji TaxID=47721 RepID=A0A9P3UQN7_LYOSH|nr:putative double-stranded RNA binding motif containing protein [Lyophyllum shimeji]